MVTFDGGSRMVQGHSVAAGAAALWTRSEVSATWIRKMTTTCAVPSGVDLTLCFAPIAHRDRPSAPVTTLELS
eukprot:8158800-Lingulodinium_polyedra.AAC.1